MDIGIRRTKKDNLVLGMTGSCPWVPVAIIIINRKYKPFDHFP